MWGALPGPANIRNWNKIEKGDRVLVNSQGKFVYYGMVLEKVHSPEIAEIAWGKDIKINYRYSTHDVVITRIRKTGEFGWGISIEEEGKVRPTGIIEFLPPEDMRKALWRVVPMAKTYANKEWIYLKTRFALGSSREDGQKERKFGFRISGVRFLDHPVITSLRSE